MSTRTLAQLPPIPSVPLLSNDEVRRLEALSNGFYIPKGELTIQPKCTTCSGEGQFRWYEGETERIVTYECPCLDQWQLWAAFLSANIPDSLMRLSWFDISGGVEIAAQEFVSDYLQHSRERVRAGVGMFLYGGMGTGKSSLAAITLKQLITEGHDGYYTTFNEMVEKYTSTWGDKEVKEWFHKRIKNASVLVIDDLGKEYLGRKEFMESIVDEIVRHRVANATPTIITSNSNVRQIGELYGPGVYSLLSESMKTHEFSGDDWRHEANTRRDREMQEGLRRPVVVLT